MVTLRSYVAQTGQVQQDWYHVDASGKIVGRLASDIAMILMGKHRPIYTPHVDTGDYVVVTNVEKIIFTGKKWGQKRYTWYSGYPGLKTETAEKRLIRRPEQLLHDAVRRMLPKNRLAKKMLDKLKLYAGPEHPHSAQLPKPLVLGEARGVRTTPVSVS